MPSSGLGQLPLHLKCFAIASSASGVIAKVALDGICIVSVRTQGLSRHGVCPVTTSRPSVSWRTKLASITTFAVNIPILTVANILGADILLAGLADGALLVVTLPLGDHSLVVEHLAVAPRTCVIVPIASHDGGGAQELEHVPTGHGVGRAAVLLSVALLADNLPIWGVAGNELIHGTEAVAAREALLVVPVVQGYHLLGWEYLNMILCSDFLNITSKLCFLYGDNEQKVIFKIQNFSYILYNLLNNFHFIMKKSNYGCLNKASAL